MQKMCRYERSIKTNKNIERKRYSNIIKYEAQKMKIDSDTYTYSKSEVRNRKKWIYKTNLMIPVPHV